MWEQSEFPLSNGDLHRPVQYSTAFENDLPFKRLLAETHTPHLPASRHSHIGLHHPIHQHTPNTILHFL